MKKYQYQYVTEFLEKEVPHKLIHRALHYTWLNTPSKNNFMNYNVHVIKAEKSKLRESLYYKVLAQQMRANGDDYTDIKEYEKYLYNNNINVNFRNIKSAPYILIYTQRVVLTTNPFQKENIQKGMLFEQTFSKGTKKYHSASGIAKFESGMFSANFTTECLRLGIDVSHVGCIPDLEYWQEPEWSFILDKPIIIQLAGYGKHYRRDYLSLKKDRKPQFEEVVNLV